MIIVMKPGCSQEDVSHVAHLVRERGLKDMVIVGTDRTVVAAIGDERLCDMTAIESAPMVDKLVPILAPYKAASREVKPTPSVIPIGAGVEVGGRKLCVIAGPCSVENEKQILTIAHAVKNAGAHALRGGAFKPRTNPYEFKGLGEDGLKLLAKARAETGLPVITEVMSIDQVPLVADYADVLQIGTRNMHNFNLLVAAGRTGKPVLLKRGWSATLAEFLLAAEYIMNEGNPNVILCERGIRTHETYVRNTLALGIIPAIKRESHLPIIIDPSQGTGHAYMVPSMSRAAIAAGADGLIIEVHSDPEHAMTDGAQSITPQVFAETMAQLALIAAAVGRAAK
ncbi:MAG: 3-deoxy-7-phosphoheptulonate synthase [Planctomycetota bacterium]|nr:MAG: 3-deoxy-7-phosphoheptulonate synthase [Planctomycetota bacterium]